MIFPNISLISMKVSYLIILICGSIEHSKTKTHKLDYQAGLKNRSIENENEELI